MNKSKVKTVERYVDETLISEITLSPDGRIFIFGASKEVLEVMEVLNPHSPKLREVLDKIRSHC